MLGKKVSTERVDPHVFVRKFLQVDDVSAIPYELGVARAIGERYSRHDFIGNPNVLTWLLGREPTTFRTFVEREYVSFKTKQRPAPSTRD